MSGGDLTAERRGWSDVAAGQRLLTVPGRGEETGNGKRPESRWENILSLPGMIAWSDS